MNRQGDFIEGGRTVGQVANFWIAAAVVAHTLWTSAAPAMTYPLYAAEWGLTHTTTTAIFAVYPVFVVAVLIAFGDISDHIGRRETMLLGLASSLAGVLLFAVAPNVSWLFVGRALMGIGVGLSASPATAAMVEFSAPGQSARASSIATTAQAFGLASATLIGGGLIQYAPLPLRLNFWVLFAVQLAVFAATWLLPRQPRRAVDDRWRVRAPIVPAKLRRGFLTAAVAVTGGYSLGAIMLSLGAQIARDVIGSSNTLVNGAAIALFAVVAGVAAIGARRLPSALAVIVGGGATALGMAFLVLAAGHHSLPLFLAAAAAAGTGYSLLFMGGLGLINAAASAEHRAGVISAVYLVAYLLMGAIALLLGVTATAWGLQTAIDLGATAIGFLSLAAIASAASMPPATDAARSLATTVRSGKPQLSAALVRVAHPVPTPRR